MTSASTRARRFNLCLPIWYRAAGESQWHIGMTRTLSTTGALVSGDGAALPSKPMTVVIALPSRAGCLVGTAHLVRDVETPASTFAISVTRCRIDRRESALRRLIH